MKNNMCVKLFSLILTVMLMLTAAPVFADQAVSVYLDGEKIEFDVEPVIEEGRTMVPVRAIFEGLGASVIWDAELNMVTAVKGRTFVCIVIGSPFMDTDTKSVRLDVPAMIVNSRTLVPLRAVSEAFDCQVSWDEVTRTVNIISSALPVQETVYAATADELLNAIGNNKKIILTAEYYDLSATNSVNNENVTKQQGFFEKSLGSYTVTNVSNMSIEGAAEIVTNDKMADVLEFKSCENITLSGLSVGHTTSYEQYRCEGAVIRLYNCKNININNCELYGCGAFGIYADGVEKLTVSGGKIYDCSYTGIWLTGYSDAVVNKTEFCDSNHNDGFIRIDDSKIVCNDCNIHNITTSREFIGVLDWDTVSEITLNNCVFTDNNFIKMIGEAQARVTFNGCTFENNNGDMMTDKVAYNNCR